MVPGKILRAKRPTRQQGGLMAAAGLAPGQWLVAFEDGRYMHLVEKYFERRETCIIDKASAEIDKRPGASNSDPGHKKKYNKTNLRQNRYQQRRHRITACKVCGRWH